MQDQHAIWLQAHKQVFSATVHTRNSTSNRVLLECCHIHEVAQLRLSHAHTGDRLTRKALCQTATDGFYFW
jgi:hypothetical protein